MQRHWMGAAAAAAVTIFACGTALADPAPAAPASPGYAVQPQAVIGGDYSYVSADHGGSASSYGGGAGGIVPFGGSFSGQVLGSVHGLSENHGGGSATDYDIGGALAWTLDMGRIGASVAYAGDNTHGANFGVTNYGVYGEYYASDAVTLGLRGGGATLNGNVDGFGGLTGHGNTTGGYVGAEAVGYATPDFDVQGHVQYVGVSQGNQTGVGVQAEYLFSESTPISASIGYDYTDLSGGGGHENTNTFSVGLHYYIGGSGSLVQRHRSGVDDWGPGAISVLF